MYLCDRSLHQNEKRDVSKQPYYELAPEIHSSMRQKKKGAYALAQNGRRDACNKVKDQTTYKKVGFKYKEGVEDDCD